MLNIKIFLLSGFLVISKLIFAQENKLDIVSGAGPSLHGSGDLSGFLLTTSATYKFSSHFGLTAGITMTRHSGEMRLTDFVFRNGIAGTSAFAMVNLKTSLGRRSELGVGLGPALHWQYSSSPDEFYEVRDANGQPQLIYTYSSPRNTTSVAYVIQPYYYYNLSKKVFLGVAVYLQNDSRQDIITGQQLLVGFRL